MRLRRWYAPLFRQVLARNFRWCCHLPFDRLLATWLCCVKTVGKFVIWGKQAKNCSGSPYLNNFISWSALISSAVICSFRCFKWTKFHCSLCFHSTPQKNSRAAKFLGLSLQVTHPEPSLKSEQIQLTQNQQQWSSSVFMLVCSCHPLALRWLIRCPLGMECGLPTTDVKWNLPLTSLVCLRGAAWSVKKYARCGPHPAWPSMEGGFYIDHVSGPHCHGTARLLR